jgi:hypothetical protein
MTPGTTPHQPLARNPGPAWFVWRDDDPSRGLTEKVSFAAQHYKRRHGHAPDVCRVHPSALGGARWRDVDGVRVTGMHNALKHHFWLRRE